MNNFSEDLKKVILAGIGAVAVTAEKSKEVVEDLVKKGELTVEQGKVLNEELKHNVAEKLRKPVSVETVEKDLQNMAHLSSSVIAKMGKDQPVHLDTIVKICVALQCDISDVVTLCNKEA